MKNILILVIAAMLAGCAASGVKITETVTRANGDVVKTVTAPASEYGDQLDAAVALNTRTRQPICRLKASGTAPITGVEAFECYGEERPVALPAAPPSAAAAIVRDVVGGVVTLGTYGIAGSVVKGVASNIERAGTAGYPYIQAPVVPAAAPASITNNIGGDGVIGDGSLNGVRGTGAAGGDYNDTHSPVDNSNHHNPVDNSNQRNQVNPAPAP